MTPAAAAEGLGLVTVAKRRRSRKWLLIAGAAVAAAVVLWMLSDRRQPADFVTQPVIRGTLIMAVSATGTLMPRDQVDVGAEVSGRIDELYVDFNDRVNRGQQLAKINTDQLQAQLNQARATLEQSQATAAQNEATFNRDRELIKEKAISPQQFDTARGDYLRSKAGMSLASAQVQQYETQLSKATIYAPIDGVVLERKVSRGQTVQAAFNTPVLFTLASDLSRMKLEVDIDEADVGAVHSGQTASFTVDAYPGMVFSAKLIAVHNAPQTTNGVVTYKGILLVDNERMLLKPGMTATADIVTGSVRDAVLVPNAALRYVPPETVAAAGPLVRGGAGLGRAWVKSGASVKPRDLKLGRSDGHVTQVLSGEIKPGEAVVIDTRSQAHP
jgi:HlyD family secretion protein